MKEKRKFCWIKATIFLVLFQLNILTLCQAQIVSSCLDGCLCTKQYAYGIRYVDCSNRKLDKIPMGSLQKLDYLILRGNNIKTIQRSDFQNFTKLFGLDLRDNPIENITSAVFYNLKNLRELMVSAINIHHFAFHGLTLLSNLRIDGSQTFNNLHVTLLKPLSKTLYNFTLTNTQVTEIPTHVLAGMTNLRYIDLRRNQLKKLGDDAFIGSSRLTSVWLSHNQLTALPTNIKNHPSLRLLDVSYNKISSINRSNFQGLSALYMLDLSNNQINNLDDHEFDGTPDLANIKLQNNRLVSIPTSLLTAKCSVLRTLDLSSNQLTTFNFSSTKICELYKLNLASNPLTQVDVSGFSKLMTLDVSNNCDMDYDVSLAIGSRVSVINLSKNCLRKLPSFFKLSSKYFGNRYRSFTSVNLYGNHFTNITVPGEIRSLNMSSNQLKSIAINFQSYRSYSTYDLSNNQLSEITKGPSAYKYGSMSISNLILRNNSFTKFDINWMIYIRNFDMSYNMLMSLDSKVFQRYFWSSRYLYNLNLRANKISSFNETMLAKLSNLMNIDLSENQITTIDDKTLKDQNQWVQNVNLSGNKLTSVSKEISNLKNLRMIDLSNNHINNISENIFNGMRYISKIYIKNNRLVNLPPGLTKFSKSFWRKVTLDLSDNELSCSCDLTVMLSSSQAVHPIGYCKQKKDEKNDEKPLHDFILSKQKLLQTTCNLCPISPCMFRGKCVENKTSGFQCNCYQGYSGRLCDVAKLDCFNDTCKKCKDMTCMNGGTCLEDDKKATCMCKENYVGDSCEIYRGKPKKLKIKDVTNQKKTNDQMTSSTVGVIIIGVLMGILILVFGLFVHRHGYCRKFKKADKMELQNDF